MHRYGSALIIVTHGNSHCVMTIAENKSDLEIIKAVEMLAKCAGRSNVYRLKSIKYTVTLIGG